MLAFRRFKQCLNNKWDFTSTYGSNGKIFRKLQMFKWVSKIKYPNKGYAVKVMLLSDALIIQLNISKYIDSIIKKFILNLNIDEQISIRGNRVRENNSIAGIIHRELKLIKFGF